MRLIGELILSCELDAIKTTSFNDPVYCGDCLNISKIWSDSGISELLFSITKYHRKNNSYKKIGNVTGNPEINEYFSDYISNLRVPASICIYPEIEDCHRLFECGFDRVGFCYEKGKETEIEYAVDVLRSQYGSQATFLVYEVCKIGKYVDELSEFINIAEKWGVGELIFKDIAAENKCADTEFCKKLAELARDSEILIGYSGGLQYEKEKLGKLKFFSSLSLGGDITFIGSNNVLPGF